MPKTTKKITTIPATLTRFTATPINQQKKRRVDQIPDASGKLQVGRYPGQNPEEVPSGHHSPQAEAPLSPQHISDDGKVQGEQVEIPDKQEGVSGNNKKSG